MPPDSHHIHSDFCNHIDLEHQPEHGKNIAAIKPTNSAATALFADQSSGGGMAGSAIPLFESVDVHHCVFFRRVFLSQYQGSKHARLRDCVFKDRHGEFIENRILRAFEPTMASIQTLKRLAGSHVA